LIQRSLLVLGHCALPASAQRRTHCSTSLRRNLMPHGSRRTGNGIS
jgi:hypothetical protein